MIPPSITPQIQDAMDKGVVLRADPRSNAAPGPAARCAGSLAHGAAAKKLKPTRHKVPMREGVGSSCGVFACAVAELLARGVLPPFYFTQAHNMAIRRGMAAQALQGKVDG